MKIIRANVSFISNDKETDTFDLKVEDNVLKEIEGQPTPEAEETIFSWFKKELKQHFFNNLPVQIKFNNIWIDEGKEHVVSFDSSELPREILTHNGQITVNRNELLEFAERYPIAFRYVVMVRFHPKEKLKDHPQLCCDKPFYYYHYNEAKAQADECNKEPYCRWKFEAMTAPNK